jgi:hypothetical protein
VLNAELGAEGTGNGGGLGALDAQAQARESLNGLVRRAGRDLPHVYLG